MSDKKFYVLADLLSYNISRSTELSESEKEQLLKKVSNGTISVKDIVKFGQEPIEIIEEEPGLNININIYFDNCDDYCDDDDYYDEQGEYEEEQRQKQRDKEYWEREDEIAFERAWNDLH